MSNQVDVGVDLNERNMCTWVLQRTKPSDVLANMALLENEEGKQDGSRQNYVCSMWNS